jgi:hypothetical protein
MILFFFALDCPKTDATHSKQTIITTQILFDFFISLDLNVIKKLNHATLLLLNKKQNMAIQIYHIFLK